MLCRYMLLVKQPAREHDEIALEHQNVAREHDAITRQKGQSTVVNSLESVAVVEGGDPLRHSGGFRAHRSFEAAIT